MHIIIAAKNITAAKQLILANKKEHAILTDGHDDFKKYVTGKDIDECLQQLEQKNITSHNKWGFLFTGQGAQRPRMMQEIYNDNPIFRRILDKCFAIYEDIFDCSIKNILFQDDDAINQTKWSQPALFIVEYAMASTWIELGIMPEYVIGHSVGEYPAAVIAGIMSLKSGIELINQRGAAMQSVTTKGSMAAFMCSLQDTMDFIKENNFKLDIAGINSSKQTVISGDIEQIEQAIVAAKTKKIRATALKVSHAFHSYHMEPILKTFYNQAEQHEFNNVANCKVISNLTGKSITTVNAKYWSDHIRQPVNFVGGISEIIANNTTNFIEVGPHPVLCAMGAKSTAENCLWLPSCNAKDELGTFYKTMGTLYNMGQINSNILVN